MDKEQLAAKIKTVMVYRSSDIYQRTQALRHVTDDNVRVNMATTALRELRASKHGDINYLINLLKDQLETIYEEEQREILEMSLGQWVDDSGDYTSPVMAVMKDDFTSRAFMDYPVDTTDNPITSILPEAPVPGMEVFYIDVGNNLSANSLIVDPSSKNIFGVNDVLEVVTDGMVKTFKYIDETIGWIYY